MSDKLIKELLINVKQKGLITVVNNLDKLEEGLGNAAAGAELLDNALKPIPAHLQEIVNEAREAEAALQSIGKSSSVSALDSQMENLDHTLTDLLGEIVHLREALVGGFNSALENSEQRTNDLVASLDRVDSAATNSARSNKRTADSLTDIADKSKTAAKGLADVGRQGRGQTRDFAALARIAGPIPMLYATIAANVYALSEAFRVLSDGAQLNRLEEIGKVMGISVGTPIQNIARDLQETTGYAVSYEDALRQASSAATFGFTSKQINEMTLAARRASVALGVDMNDALNRILRGVSKLEVELLDELGITVRLEEAYSKYANALGISATALTGYQKQQAYLNAVLEESARRQSKVDPYLQANGWELLGASVKSTTLEGVKWVADVLEPTARYFAEALGSEPFTEMSKKLGDVGDMYKEISKETNESDFLANAFVAFSEQVSGELPKKLKEAKALVEGYSIDASGIFNLSAAFDLKQLSEAKKDIKAYEDAQALLNKRLEETLGIENKLTAQQKVRAGESVKQARAANNEAETLAKISVAAKGTKQDYEVLAESLNNINASREALAKDAAGVSFFGQATKLTNEGLMESTTLMGALRNEFIARTTEARRMIELEEIAYTQGQTAGELAKSKLALEIQTLQVEGRRLELAKASGSAILANQEAINTAKLKERATNRQIEQEQLSRLEAMGELFNSQQRFNGTYSSYLSDLDIEKQENAANLQNLEMRLASLSGVNTSTTEILGLELQINEAKRRAVDLNAQEIIQQREKANALRESLATRAGGEGSISASEGIAAGMLQSAEDLRAAGQISLDAYREMVLQGAQLQGQAVQERLEQQAALENLFMNRAGASSTIAMNAEEELAYQQQLGAQIYDNARSSLEAFDPVMGEMMNGIEGFAYALKNVGETSNGVWNGVASGIQAAAGIMQFASSQAVASIDKQIEAEKKKDGKSAESKKKIAQLEAKRQKEEIKGKRISIISSTATGIMQAFAQLGPWGAVPAAMIAAMGAMQLSSLDSGSIADPSSASDPSKLELGTRSNAVDVANGATSGELDFLRGNKGIGTSADFVPRARGSSTSPNVSYITGEHGAEVVSTSSPSNVTSSEEAFNGSRGQSLSVQFNISALDSGSILDRAADIWAAVESEAAAKGFSLSRI